jgi:hypothetical protein
LIHGGGLRAEVVTGETIRVEDAITENTRQANYSRASRFNRALFDNVASIFVITQSDLLCRR